MAYVYLERIVFTERVSAPSGNVLTPGELWAREDARFERQNAALSDRQQHSRDLVRDVLGDHPVHAVEVVPRGVAEQVVEPLEDVRQPVQLGLGPAA